MKPVKLCHHPGCHQLVNYTDTYCVKHERKEKVSDSYQYRKRKDGKYHTFYKTPRWEKLSQLQRIKQPVCEMCLEQGIIKQADVADHIIPIRDDWSKRYDTDNLQSLCIYHNNVKGREERAKRKQKNEI